MTSIYVMFLDDIHFLGQLLFAQIIRECDQDFMSCTMAVDFALDFPGCCHWTWIPLAKKKKKKNFNSSLHGIRVFCGRAVDSEVAATKRLQYQNEEFSHTLG